MHTVRDHVVMGVYIGAPVHKRHVPKGLLNFTHDIWVVIRRFQNTVAPLIYTPASFCIDNVDLCAEGDVVHCGSVKVKVLVHFSVVERVLGTDLSQEVIDSTSGSPCRFPRAVLACRFLRVHRIQPTLQHEIVEQPTTFVLLVGVYFTNCRRGGSSRSGRLRRIQSRRRPAFS